MPFDSALKMLLNDTKTDDKTLTSGTLSQSLWPAHCSQLGENFNNNFRQKDLPKKVCLPTAVLFLA